MTNIKTLAVKCPTCGTEVLMVESNAYRPFCSKRCRDIDFGNWANEDNKIPGQNVGDMWSEDISE